MQFSFFAEFLNKGGASEMKCQKIALITQELDDTVASAIPLLHKQLVKVTIDFE